MIDLKVLGNLYLIKMSMINTIHLFKILILIT